MMSIMEGIRGFLCFFILSFGACCTFWFVRIKPLGGARQSLKEALRKLKAKEFLYTILSWRMAS